MKKFLQILFFSFVFFIYTAHSAEQAPCDILKSEQVKVDTLIKQMSTDRKGDKKFLNALRSNQKAWLSYVDTQLALQFPGKPGDYGSSYSLCACSVKADLYKQRYAQLQQWVQPQEEGDVCVGSKRH